MSRYTSAAASRSVLYSTVQYNDFEVVALHFTGALLLAVTILQRFALPFGAKPISIVGPVGFAIAAWGFARGVLAIDRNRLIAFGLLLAWIAFGMICQALWPNAFGTEASLPSVAQFVVLTGFGCLSLARPIDEAKFFAQVNRVLSWIAIAGIAQFALQFVGLKLFAFTGLLPTSILYETDYNLVIPAGIGDLLKANGFFLVEPSVFSQFMAVGLIVEFLTTRRASRLCMFLLGLLLSFSGTGWLVLLVFAVTAPIGLGRKGLNLTIAMILMLSAAVGIGLAVVPDLAAVVGNRLAEFGRIGTSAHLRFITPFWLIGSVLSRAPQALLIGIGGGASEALYLPYLYNVNTPVKVLLEYGAPALIAYVAIFVSGTRTPTQRTLVLPVLAMFLFGGGYQQFPPLLFFTLLLLCVARLAPATEKDAPA